MNHRRTRRRGRHGRSTAHGGRGLRRPHTPGPAPAHLHRRASAPHRPPGKPRSALKANPDGGTAKSIARPDARPAAPSYRPQCRTEGGCPMNQTTRTAIACGLACTLLGAAACGGNNTDKAGGGGDAEATVLTFALITGSPPRQLESWAQSLADESNGNITVDFQPGWRDGETDFEQGTITDIQSGKVDMGWVGARVFDRVGVNSFQALLAPLLVDSH